MLDAAMDPMDPLSMDFANTHIHNTSKNRLPLSPKCTLTEFPHLLSDYEKSEILNFPDIFFVGTAQLIKIGKGRRSGMDRQELNIVRAADKEPSDIFNDGYDDSRGDYYLTKRDHIGYRYEILSLLGKGSFGQVVKCFDHKKQINVAVKMIRNKKRFEKQGLVEVKILKYLKEQDPDDSHSIIHIQDHFYFRNHLCITFELLGINLYEWIRAGSFRGVHLEVVKSFAYQMLKCLDLLSKCHIIHCDMKPENVLLKSIMNKQPSKNDSNMLPLDPSKCHSIPSDFDPFSSRYVIKVIDFGSSCFEDERVYTYVQSRFYRSPEIILGIPYGCSIDMWSFGCILTELFTGYPLFPGENENEQLACVMEIFGVPSPEVLAQGTRKRHFFDSKGNPRIVANSKGKRKRPSTKSLTNTLPTSDASFMDFIRKCLNWNPNERMSAEEGLKHPWINSLFNRLPNTDIYSRGGGLIGNMKNSLENSKYDVSTYSNSIGPGILPDVKGFKLSKKDYSMPNLKSVSYISSSNSVLHKITHPGGKRAYKNSTISGLPPISLSNQNGQKAKYSGIESLNRKNTTGNYTKDTPAWRI